MKTIRNIVILILTIPAITFAQETTATCPLFYNPFGMMYGYGGGLGGGLLSLLFWILIIWVIFMIFRYSTRDDIEKRSSNSLKILRERYAKGEIDKKQFEEMKKDLER